VRAARYVLLVLLLLTAGTLARPDAAFAPGKPRSLKASADGARAVKLDWRRVSGAALYYVYRDGNRVAQSDRSDYRDEGLEPSTTYVYRVSAVDDAGDEGALSDPAQVTTEALPGPSAPTDLAATAVGPYRIDLTWSASESEVGVEYYRVMRDDVEIATTDTLAYADTGLNPETRYEYRVSAVDSLGKESDRSERASATTPAEPGPGPPRNVSAASAGATQIHLAWDPPVPSAHPVQGYNVYREGASIGFVLSTAFINTGLSPETTYRYTVSAVDDRGVEGESSEEVSATTDAATDIIPPAAPTGLRLAGS